MNPAVLVGFPRDPLGRPLRDLNPEPGHAGLDHRRAVPGDAEPLIPRRQQADDLLEVLQRAPHHPEALLAEREVEQRARRRIELLARSKEDESGRVLASIQGVAALDEFGLRVPLASFLVLPLRGGLPCAGCLGERSGRGEDRRGGEEDGETSAHTPSYESPARNPTRRAD
jgi:hypothetical protein